MSVYSSMFRRLFHGYLHGNKCSISAEKKALHKQPFLTQEYHEHHEHHERIEIDHTLVSSKMSSFERALTSGAVSVSDYKYVSVKKTLP